MKNKVKHWLRIILVTASLAAFSLGVALSPARASADDWWAEYYATIDLTGAPVVSRYDSAINYTWGTGRPAAEVPHDGFSVRWTREAWFQGGTYRFEVLSDDGVRIWVGDRLVVDEWRDRWATPFFADHYIPEGTHRVRVEYYDHTGDATIAVGWRHLAGGAWRGEYFDTIDLSGWPTIVRDDAAIDFDWGAGSPDPSIPADDFSVRWTAVLELEAGAYRFLASTDDGVRVWVDDRLLIDAWLNQALPKTHTGDIQLTGGRHTIRVEYYEHGGGAAAHVWWETLDGAATGWRGEYFANATLTGGPALVRRDEAINFDWATGPPISWMPDDGFSTRWTRSIDFEPGYYRFAVQADDGVRVWVDQRILIDRWQEMDYELHYVDGTYLEGPHTVKVEYFERTGSARIRFWWERGTDGNQPPSGAGPELLPAMAPIASSGPPPAEVDPWQASYYRNTELRGAPVMTRIEETLDHRWGFGSPGPGVPDDRFSARWTQPLYFRAGLYRFTTTTDDGVRLWIDGEQVIDAWYGMRGSRSATVRLAAGVHDVRVEYFELTGAARAWLTWRRVGR